MLVCVHAGNLNRVGPGYDFTARDRERVLGSTEGNLTHRNAVGSPQESTGNRDRSAFARVERIVGSRAGGCLLYDAGLNVQHAEVLDGVIPIVRRGIGVFRHGGNLAACVNTSDFGRRGVLHFQRASVCNQSGLLRFGGDLGNRLSVQVEDDVLPGRDGDARVGRDRLVRKHRDRRLRTVRRHSRNGVGKCRVAGRADRGNGVVRDAVRYAGYAKALRAEPCVAQEAV